MMTWNRLERAEYASGKIIQYEYDDAGNRTVKVMTVPPASDTVYVNADGLCDGNLPCFTAVQAGMNAVAADGMVKIVAGAFAENVVFDEAKTIALQGGWDSSFSTYTGKSTVRSLRMTNGKMRVNNVRVSE